MAAALGTGVGLTGFFAVLLVALLAGVTGLMPAHAAERTALRPTADAGPTLPIETVLAEIQPEGTQTELVSDMAAAFPVATRGLRQAVLRRPGSLPRAYVQWLAQPIALVADDEASRRWLMQQGDALHALGASVLVVRVRSEERMRAMRSVRADLPMAPAAAPELVAALRAAGSAVYPLVIITDGTLRQDVRPLAVRQQAGRPGQAQTPSGGRSVYPPAGGPT
jgi:integrating conjugative element protein (TIGR03765 family)